MQNSFNSIELTKWFLYNYSCWYCGRNHWDCFHHVLGRSGKYNNSILNAAPLNNFECHLPIHGKLRSKENKITFLKKTMRWLLEQGYILNHTDKGFIEQNQELYESILSIV